MKGEYLALTYCWGKARHYDMMLFGPRSRPKQGQPDPEPNIEAHKAAIPTSSMPQSLQDVVVVARGLGFRYIWVDALCIIQGDDEEWQNEHPRLSDVYLHATLVIAADKASDLNAGFLGARQSELRVTQIHALKHIPTDSHDVESLCPSPLLLDEPLNQRAWSLSEAIFSVRIVHFTSSGMIWECNTVRRSEDGSYQNLEEDDTDSFRMFRNETIARRCTVSELYSKWNKVVEHFTRRQINSHPDERYKDPLKLVAIARLARRFSEILKLVTGHEDLYLGGLWKADLPGSLLWTTEIASANHLPIQTRRSQIQRAPSWSWASIEGPVVLGNLTEFHADCKVEEISVTEGDQSDPFGQISSGSMIIRGRAAWVISACYQDGMIVCDGIKFSSDVQLAEEDMRSPFSCLYLGSSQLGGPSDGSSGLYHAILLLRAVEGRPWCFERVGISSRLSMGVGVTTLLDSMASDVVTMIQ